MKQPVLCIALLLAWATLFGCEGVVYVEGEVVSAEDGAPLDSARVLYRYAGSPFVEDSTLTDTTGAFNVGTFTGCVPGCPNADVDVRRPGYEPYRQTFDSSMVNGLRVSLRRVAP